MSGIPKKMQEFAAIYGCEIVEGYITENEIPSEALFARAKASKMVSQRWYVARTTKTMST